jgi:signal transduction histidine kinase/HAMP domain-containing protein
LLPSAWRPSSLNAKILVSIVGLMLVSLLVSTLTFVMGTARTRRQLLKRQIADDTERVRETMGQRAAIVANAAAMLANDPAVFTAARQDAEASLDVLNSRAVVLRDRFDLDVIQIYDQQGQARTNLMLSSLYRESEFLGLVTSNTPVVQVIDGRALLLSRATMPGDFGTVIAGIDLKTELHRLVSQYRLSADLGLRVGDFKIGTSDDLPFNAQGGQIEEGYINHLTVTLGQTPVDLLLMRSAADIRQVTTTGLTVMIGSLVLTTLLLITLGALITRSVARPIHQLSLAAEKVAQGNLDERVDINQRLNIFGFGEKDEIGLLAATFNSMIRDLRMLYEDLEARVDARTADLSTAAQVAAAVSSSLDLEHVLQTSARLIQEQLGLYHVGIWLTEPGTSSLQLHASYDETGEFPENLNFRLAVGSGSLIGKAASRGEPAVVLDVSCDPLYLEAPHLPDTRSEAVIPLLVDETVIGVLDVQSAQPNVFSQDMISLLCTLADQIATGVHNAQSYDRQRQMAEYLAEANARLQELDRTKDKFIQNVSHELRTPLALIRGYAESLESGLLGELKEEHQQPISVIARRSRMMTQLVDDITALLEIETREPEMTPVSLPELVQAAAEDFQALAERKNLTMRAEIPASLPSVMGQKYHLRRVIDNLVNNAIKFTPEEGTVTVRLSQHDSHVFLQVEDTGIGIPPEKQEHVFERFYQVDGTISRQYGGSGLGLALVKEVVELHQGAVSLESEVGHGSTFTVTFPVITS